MKSLMKASWYISTLRKLVLFHFMSCVVSMWLWGIEFGVRWHVSYIGLQCSCLLAANELRFVGTGQGIIMSPNSCICVHFLFLYVCISFWVVLAWQKASGLGQNYGMPRHSHYYRMPRHHHVHGNSGNYSPSLYSYSFQECIYLEMYFKPCQSHLSWLLQLIYVGTLIVGCWSAICTWRYRTHVVNSMAYRKPWKSECLLIYFCLVWEVWKNTNKTASLFRLLWYIQGQCFLIYVPWISPFNQL